jgi:hypothetical protein
MKVCHYEANGEGLNKGYKRKESKGNLYIRSHLSCKPVKMIGHEVPFWF